MLCTGPAGDDDDTQPLNVAGNTEAEVLAMEFELSSVHKSFQAQTCAAEVLTRVQQTVLKNVVKEKNCKKPKVPEDPKKENMNTPEEEAGIPAEDASVEGDVPEETPEAGCGTSRKLCKTKEKGKGKVSRRRKMLGSKSKRARRSRKGKNTPESKGKRKLSSVKPKDTEKEQKKAGMAGFCSGLESLSANMCAWRPSSISPI